MTAEDDRDGQFLLMGAKPLVQDSPSMKLHELLTAFHRRPPQGTYQREKSGAGGPSPNRLGMFKLISRSGHGLSCPAGTGPARTPDFMSYRIRPSRRVADASTICRFRNRLVTAGRSETAHAHQWATRTAGTEGARRAWSHITPPSFPAARPNRYLKKASLPRIDSPDQGARAKGQDLFGYRGQRHHTRRLCEHVQVPRPKANYPVAGHRPSSRGW